VFGVDLEQPRVVAAGAVAMVILAALALTWRRSLVMASIALFALVFAAFDVREALHQHAEGRPSLIVIATVLACMHMAVALLATISARSGAGTGEHVTS
jgi:O-antigen/teichoic acid export membrane protein